MVFEPLIIFKYNTAKGIFSKIKPLGWIYIVAIIESICYFWYAGIYAYNDTWSYLEAWQVIKTGHISVFRTPVYPILLGVLYEIFGQHGVFWATAFVQYCVLLLSIKYYFLTTGFFIKQPIWRYTVCYLYILHPMIFQWASFMYTEALSIAGIIFLFYVLGRIWTGNWKPIHIFNLFLLPLLLIMLRPGFVYLIPILFLFVLGLFWKNKQAGKYSFIAFLGSLLLIIGYGYLFKYNFGVFGFSSVSAVNQATILQSYGLWDEDLIQTPEEKALIERLEVYGEEETQPWLRSNECWDRLNAGELNSFHARLDSKDDLIPYNSIIQKQIQNNPIGYLKTIYLRTWDAQTRPILPLYTQKTDYYILAMITPSFNLYWILFIGFTIFLVFYYSKIHVIPFFSFILFITVYTGILISLVGANGEWSRLSLPSMPLALIILGMVLNKLKLSSYPECP